MPDRLKSDELAEGLFAQAQGATGSVRKHLLKQAQQQALNTVRALNRRTARLEEQLRETRDATLAAEKLAENAEALLDKEAADKDGS